MTNVQERVPTAAVALPANAARNAPNQAAIGTSRGAMVRSSDMIRRIAPSYLGIPVDPPPFNGIVQQLLNIIQQLLSALGLGGLFGGFGSYGGYGNTYFQSASGASAGDPHLSFNGTTGAGANEQSHFDSMAGHNDLLDSDSFAGGYRISTSVTQPNANGVTRNQQATITTGFDETQVSLDNAGNAAIEQNGQTIVLANGQSYNLGNGEVVTRNSDGSVVVSDDNGMGGTISTTLRDNGQGVDVSAQAANVELGGDLVSQSTMQPPPPGRPIFQPMEQR